VLPLLQILKRKRKEKDGIITPILGNMKRLESIASSAELISGDERRSYDIAMKYENEHRAGLLGMQDYGK
jgi:putative N-acetylmannosamine-6-phosphate epimerase